MTSFESIFLPDGINARVRPAPGFSGGYGPPSLDLSFRTTPGHQSGAGVSQETALELAARILIALREMGATELADCSCGGTYSVPQGGNEYAALETAHQVHIDSPVED